MRAARRHPEDGNGMLYRRFSGVEAKAQPRSGTEGERVRQIMDEDLCMSVRETSELYYLLESDQVCCVRDDEFSTEKSYHSFGSRLGVSCVSNFASTPTAILASSPTDGIKLSAVKLLSG